MKLEQMKEIAAERTKGEWGYSTCYGVATIEDENGTPIAHAVNYLTPDNATFIEMASNKWDKLMAVVEAAKSIVVDDEECDTCYPELIPLRKALEALEQE